MKRALFSGIGIFLLLAVWVSAYGQPAPEMYTLDQIYYYLAEGTESSWGEYSLEPQSGVPGGAIPGYSKNLGDIYDDAEAKFRQCDATAADVSAGKVFFSTQTNNWGVQTGTLSAGGGLLQTGQSFSYHTGDDGTYQKGTAFSYQTSDPAGNGEIVTTGNVTGLMWASAGNAAGCNWGNQTTWTAAIDWAEGLTFAGYDDWRLPNRRELESIVDSSRYNPVINTTYFPNTVSPGWYVSGSTFAGSTGGAWYVNFESGAVLSNTKTNDYWYVRAVRDAE